MKISENFFQFPKKSIIVISGSYSAEIYYAYDGSIDKIESFKIEAPSYSDREGFFTRSGRGMVYGSGSVNEENKKENIGKFLKELKDKIDNSIKDYSFDESYILTPKHIKNEIKKYLPEKLKQKSVKFIEGNFVEMHPFSFIKKIEKAINKKRIIIASEKVIKMLKRKK
jgi:hypothetical protein